jgi:hypothetical protein
LGRGSVLAAADEVAGLAAGLLAGRRRHVGGADLLAVFRIQRLRVAEDGLPRQAVELDELVGKRILVGREVGDAVARLAPS